MTVSSKPVTEPKTGFSSIPVIDISHQESKHALVKACEDFGFFKVINHRVSQDVVSILEREAVAFFSLPKSEKTRLEGYPFGYGDSNIGRNGDVGWVEYLLMNANLDSVSDPLLPETFSMALEEYTKSVRNMTCEVLEMMADGLGIKQRNTISKLVSGENTDSLEQDYRST